MSKIGHFTNFPNHINQQIDISQQIYKRKGREIPKRDNPKRQPKVDGYATMVMVPTTGNVGVLVVIGEEPEHRENEGKVEKMIVKE